MKVDGRYTRTIWVEADGASVGTIDQTQLPHRYTTIQLKTVQDAAHAIKSMQVRGAPLIGAVAAYGVALALRADASDAALERAYALLFATRPTAINLKWALDEMMAAVRNRAREDRLDAAYKRAQEIADEDVEINAAIGRNGLRLIEEIAATKKPGAPVNVLTHCNAGWLATVDWGTATSPIYQAHDQSIPIEQRGADEVTTMTGKTADGRIESVRIVPDGSAVANYGFDVTPARLVTGLITERGVIPATRAGLARAFPERAEAAARPTPSAAE